MTTPAFQIREATLHDIPRMHEIRLAVKENALSNPLLVQEKDYAPFLTGNNKGWVAVSNETITGFAIIDIERANIWALFVHPGWEGRGAGRKLHDTMISWYFNAHTTPLWLTTAPGTRAERFYTKSGWRNCGPVVNGEIRFEMDRGI